MAYQEIDVNEFESVVGDDAQLIDVREPAELVDGTLPGVVNIPLGDLSSRVAELDPSRRVVLVCRSGGRSGQAAGWLDDNGFSDVINLAGGMLAYGSSPT